MALAFQRTKVSMKETTIKITIPSSPKGKLMYYVNCMATVLQLDELPKKFRDYAKYDALDATETRQLLEICKLLAPDVLTNKCIFEMDDLAGMSNRFFELSSAKSTMVATENIMIGGKSIKVAKIMAYTRAWRRNNYDVPLVSCTRSLTSSTRRSTKRDSCILL